MFEFKMELIVREKENNKKIIKDDIIFNIDDYTIEKVTKYEETKNVNKTSKSIITHIKNSLGFSYCIPKITEESTMLKNAYNIKDIEMIVSRDIIRKETDRSVAYDYGFVIKRNMKISKNLFVDMLLYSPSAELMLGMQGMIRDSSFNKRMKEMLEIDKCTYEIKSVDIWPIIQEFKFNINRKLTDKDTYRYGYDTLLIHKPSIRNDSIRKMLGVPKPYYCKTNRRNGRESFITKEGGLLYKIFR